MFPFLVCSHISTTFWNFIRFFCTNALWFLAVKQWINYCWLWTSFPTLNITLIFRNMHVHFTLWPLVHHIYMEQNSSIQQQEDICPYHLGFGYMDLLMPLSLYFIFLNCIRNFISVMLSIYLNNSFGVKSPFLWKIFLNYISNSNCDSCCFSYWFLPGRKWLLIPSLGCSFIEYGFKIRFFSFPGLAFNYYQNMDTEFQ